jgi:hypothetical protein
MKRRASSTVEDAPRRCPGDGILVLNAGARRTGLTGSWHCSPPQNLIPGKTPAKGRAWSLR